MWMNVNGSNGPQLGKDYLVEQDSFGGVQVVLRRSPHVAPNCTCLETREVPHPTLPFAVQSTGSATATDMPARNRREMAQHLEEVMSHAYTELEERRRLETQTSLLKTYLLEAHSESTGQRDILRLLQNGFWPGMVA